MAAAHHRFMKSNISIVLDRSASMEKIKAATIKGYNEFLSGQKAEPGTAVLKLVLFDHEYLVAYNGNIQDAPSLSDKTFLPRGSTALLDAIGRNINEIGLELNATAEADRPDTVIVVVITDGEENASQEFTREQVFASISHQTDKYQWKFLFLGAGPDAIATAAKLGIGGIRAMRYNANESSMSSVMESVNVATSSLRGGSSYAFTQDDRDKAQQ